MKKAAFLIILFTLVMLLAGTLSAAAAPRYLCKDLGHLGGGYSQANAINNAGQVAGASWINGSTRHAFLYSGGSMHDLGTLPGGANSEAFAINASGQVAGYSEYGSFGYPHAFLDSGGSMQDLGMEFGANSSSYAYGINAAGQVVGSYVTPSQTNHAFLYSGGSMHDLDTLGGNHSFAYGINDLGQVVGSSNLPSGAIHAFLYSDEVMQDNLGTQGGSPCGAYAINNAGVEVGQGSYDSGIKYAFLYNGVVFQNLGGYKACAINATGQVVGDYSTDPWLYSPRAFLYSGEDLEDLSGLVQNLPTGVYLTLAKGINDWGQIAACGSNVHAYLLTPIRPLSALDILLLE